MPEMLMFLSSYLFIYLFRRTVLDDLIAYCDILQGTVRGRKRSALLQIKSKRFVHVYKKKTLQNNI